MSRASEAVAVLKTLGDGAIAAHAQGFFRTGPGGYGEGDRFLGIRVPPLRAEAKRWRGMPLGELRQLLGSEWHEARLLALLVLVGRFEKGDEAERGRVYDLYLDCRDRVNNWDLVDTSAPQIVGGYLEGRERGVLRELAGSETLWDRRIAIMATFWFIRRGEFADTLELADLLLEDPEDLMHKAVGWMLREVGKRDRAAEAAFLRSRYRRMPRTMLRYAIEKFPEAERQRYLRGEV